MRRRSIIAAAVSAVAMASLSRPAHADDAVDVLLVLATDVSRSVDEGEARLQRDGYYASLTDPRVMEAIQNGPLGAIGLAYVEWSGEDHQAQPVPWMRIASQADAEAWVGALERHPPRAHGWTSISGAIDFSRTVLARAPWTGTRRVVDISGDGMNNSGREPALARDAAVEAGITINGLPILKDRPIPGAAPLDDYYRESVIGGPGAFVIPAGDFGSFALALRRKLILEIAGAPVPAEVARA